MFKGNLHETLPPLKSGYLKKPGHYVHSWKTRWYVLTKNSLIRFERSSDISFLAKKVGELKLQEVLDVECDPSFVYKKKKHCFQIITAKFVYIIRGGSSKESKEWVDAIKQALGDLRGKDGSTSQSVYSVKRTVTRKSYRTSFNQTLSFKNLGVDETFEVNLGPRGLFVISVPDNISIKNHVQYYESQNDYMGNLKVIWDRVDTTRSSSTAFIIHAIALPAVAFGIFYYRPDMIKELAGENVVVRALIFFGLVLLVMQFIWWNTADANQVDWQLVVCGWMPSDLGNLDDGSEISDSETEEVDRKRQQVAKDRQSQPFQCPFSELHLYNSIFEKAIDRGRFVKSEPRADACLNRWVYTHKWRDEEGVGEVLKRPYPLYKTLRLNCPTFILGRAKDGSRIYVEKPSGINIKGLADSGCTMDDLLYHYIFMTEYLWNYVETSEAGRVFVIVDIENVGFREAMATETVEFLKKILRILQDHYPERVSKVFILNAPVWFSTFWSIISPFCSDVTKNKIEVCNAKESLLQRNHSKLLLKHIDERELPKEYGGQTALNFGEWNRKLDGLVTSLNGDKY